MNAELDLRTTYAKEEEDDALSRAAGAGSTALGANFLVTSLNYARRMSRNIYHSRYYISILKFLCYKILFEPLSLKL